MAHNGGFPAYNLSISVPLSRGRGPGMPADAQKLL